MPGPNSEDNTTDERGPETSTRTDIGGQNMPSATAFADMFKAALVPVLSQLTNLNENVSSVVLDGQDEPDEDGETASGDGPAKTADMVQIYLRSSPLRAKMIVTRLCRATTS